MHEYHKHNSKCICVCGTHAHKSLCCELKHLAPFVATLHGKQQCSSFVKYWSWLLQLLILYDINIIEAEAEEQNPELAEDLVDFAATGIMSRFQHSSAGNRYDTEAWQMTCTKFAQ